MTDRKKNVFMNLKLSQSGCSTPLFEGNNSILSDLYPELSSEKLILFNLNIINEEDAILRTFDHFPIIIKNIKNESLIEDSFHINKQTLINLKGIYKYQIFPLKSDDYFEFEKPKLPLETEKNSPQISNFKEIKNQEYENLMYVEDKENNEEDAAIISQPQIAPTFYSENLNNLDENNFESTRKVLEYNEASKSPKPVEAEMINPHESLEEKIEIVEDQLEVDREKELMNMISSIEEDLEMKNDDQSNEIDKLIEKSSKMEEDEFESASQQEIIENILPVSLVLADQDQMYDILNKKENNDIITLPEISDLLSKRSVKVIEDNDEITETQNQDLIAQPNNVPTTLKTSRKSLRFNKQESSTSINLEEVMLNRKRKRKNPISTPNESSQIIEAPSITLVPPCSICLDQITNLSKLDACGHEFCRECISSWAEVSSNCPLCKMAFKKIIFWEENQKLEKRVRKRKFKYQEEDAEPWLENCAEYCMVCHNNNDEHLLLVCDKCHFNICHTYCAGLEMIPDEDWICKNCTRVSTRRSASNANLTRASSQRLKEIPQKIERLEKSSVSTRRSYAKANENVKDKNYRIKMNRQSNKRDDSNNINISYNVSNNNIRKKSLKLNFKVNLHFSEDKKGKGSQTPKPNTRRLRKRSDTKKKR